MTTTPIPQKQLANLIRAQYPVVAITSAEESRVEFAVCSVAKILGRSLWTWTISDGLVKVAGEAPPNAPDQDETIDPAGALQLCRDWNEETESIEGAIFLFKDLHPLMSPPVVRLIRDICSKFTSVAHTLILLSLTFADPPTRDGLPVELGKQVFEMDWPLPTQDEIDDLLGAFLDSLKDRIDITVNGDRVDVVRSLAGLTESEISNTLALIAVQTGRFDAAEAIPMILVEKREIIKQSGALEFYEPNLTDADVGGLDILKSYARQKRNAFSPAALEYGLDAPRGFMMVGVPGTGKSLSAKVAGGGILPVLRFDPGAAMGSLVGQSEGNTRTALRVVDAVAPCVLWIDELEKAYGGGGGDLDGGTSKRVLSTLLTWMQEHTSSVLVIATANDVRTLPPELLRRFDDTFWVDLPNAQERSDILEIHLTKRGRNVEDFDLTAIAEAMVDFTGAEVEKVVKAALVVGFDEGAREITAADLLAVAKDIVPVARTMDKKIGALREWAKTRARPASSAQPEATAAAPENGRTFRKLDI